jgi:hypothetical protein
MSAKYLFEKKSLRGKKGEDTEKKEREKEKKEKKEKEKKREETERKEKREKREEKREARREEERRGKKWNRREGDHKDNVYPHVVIHNLAASKVFVIEMNHHPFACKYFFEELFFYNFPVSPMILVQKFFSLS